MRKLQAYMENTTLNISPSTVDELLAQYHHRLLALEADLKDRAKAGTISAGVLARRVRRLKEIHNDLSLLATQSGSENTKDHMSHDLGLPELNQCCEEERSIVEGFLKERVAEVQAHSKQAKRVLSWLEDSLSGRAGGLRLTFRLSKLRNFIAIMERLASTESEASSRLELQTETLLADAQIPEAQKNAKSTLAASMALFTKLDTIITRIAKLKASVKREQIKTDAMLAWLDREEKSLAHVAPQMPPPTPLMTAQATQAIQPTLLRGIEQAKKRHDLVLRFWEQVVTPTPLPHRAGASSKKEP